VIEEEKQDSVLVIRAKQKRKSTKLNHAALFAKQRGTEMSGIEEQDKNKSRSRKGKNAPMVSSSAKRKTPSKAHEESKSNNTKTPFWRRERQWSDQRYGGTN
jgi:hypothetical protein